MPEVQEIKNRMKGDGFTLITEYNDPANEHFPLHDHERDEFLVVISGSISFAADNEEFVLSAGDERFFPAKQSHSATIGPSGCFYIVGEKE